MKSEWRFIDVKRANSPAACWTNALVAQRGYHNQAERSDAAGEEGYLK
jgi:hypothetical protein